MQLKQHIRRALSTMVVLTSVIFGLTAAQSPAQANDVIWSQDITWSNEESDNFGEFGFFDPHDQSLTDPGAGRFPPGSTHAALMLPAACNINAATWINATDGSPTSWGRVRYCTATDATGTYPLIQVDDTQTDGYQVHVEFMDNFSGVFHATGNGAGCATVQSSGSIFTSCWDGNTWGYYGSNDLRMRLVRGRACCPHQDVDHWEYVGVGGTDWWYVIST